MERNNNQPNTTPRIYAACLAAYNHGELHCDWIDADQEPEDIETEIRQMLQRSPIPRSEEWAIHDYQGFSPYRPNEYETIHNISRIALGIVEHGAAYAHWAAIHGGIENECLEHFEDHYLGSWESLAAYAEHLVDDIGEAPERWAPDWLKPYVTLNYEALGRDLSMDMHSSWDEGDIHLFHADC